MSEHASILVLLQPLAGAVHPISLKTAAAAAALARTSGRRAFGAICAEALTPGMRAALEGCGLEAVVVLRGSFGGFLAEEQCREIAAYIEELCPDVVLAGATPEGRALAALLAARLRTGVTADSTALSFTDDGLLRQTRPAFGGDVMAEIVTPFARPQIATLRYGGDAIANAAHSTGITVRDVFLTPADGVTAEWVERVGAGADAQRIIAIGGGLRAREDIPPFARLAERVGAELCCSRALVERGWMSRSAQIGLSGRSVSARLLITFGVSGSVQFQAGISSVGRLCAVTDDASAPILRVADVPILGDLYEVAREMNARLKAESLAYRTPLSET